jgi:hypothetical protein
LLLLLLILSPARDSGIDYGHAELGGGAGPVGGGGGGSPGNGVPRINFVRVTPRTVATVVPAKPQKVEPVIPPPVPPPVVAPKPRTVAPVTPPVVAPPVASPSAASAGAVASGTGNGTTGGAGAGPGSGGGVGSGEGTGHGSGVGSGTGGGPAKDQPPTLKQFILPPLPTPNSVKGFTLTAWFDVDTAGNATLLRFTPTPDGGYNDRVRATLKALKFRPGVRADGSPVRDTVDIQVFF